MRRCLETALLSLDFLINGKKVPIVAHAGWQENSAKPCDTGSPLASIAPDFPSVDFSQVDPVFPDKTSPAGAHYFYTRKALLGRAQACLRELHARPEKVIAVVSHSGFMRTSVTGCYYMNADYRIFDYAERSPEDEAGEIPFVLVQREETKASGGGMGTSWTDEVVLGDGLPDEDGAFNHGAPN